MKWPEIETSQWKDFEDVITNMTDQGDLLKNRFFFRGQSDKAWSLFPSFTRILNQANGHGFLLKNFEAVVVKKFMAMARQHIPINLIPDDEDLVGWWQLMQHYGAPTRLLDWTISPYVAAYFAVTENLDKDGAIWVMNYSCLEKAVDDELKKNRCPITETDTYYVMNSLLQNANFIRATNTTHKNQRALVQQAELTFTVNVFYDQGLTIQNLLDDWTKNNQVETGKTILTVDNNSNSNSNRNRNRKLNNESVSRQKYFKIVIPKDSKMDYLARLHTANISASSLFPGLDGVGAAIKEEIDWQIYIAIKNSTS